MQAKARKSLLSERYRQLNHCHDNFPLVHNVLATGARVSIMNLMGFAEDTELPELCAVALSHSLWQPSPLMMLYWFKVFH